MQINLFSYPSMSIKTLEIRENSMKNYGVYLQNLLYLGYQFPWVTKHGTKLYTKIQSFYGVDQHANY